MFIFILCDQKKNTESRDRAIAAAATTAAPTSDYRKKKFVHLYDRISYISK